MTALITPGRQYEHLDAARAKDTLLMFARLEPQSFNIKMAEDESVMHSDPFEFYRDFFLRVGLLERSDGGGVQLTQSGIELATGQIREPISRVNADVEIGQLKKRAAWILDDPDQLFYLRSVFIFGSYVDSDKPMLGDIDVGVSYGLKPEYQKMSNEQLMLIARSIHKRALAGQVETDIDDPRIWAKERMLAYLHSGLDFISLHASTELPSLRIHNVMWVYDSRNQVVEPFKLSRREMVTINHFLHKTI
ncbi:MAG: hypothetical protein RSD49_18000 [Hafnia sp.]